MTTYIFINMPCWSLPSTERMRLRKGQEMPETQTKNMFHVLHQKMQAYECKCLWFQSYNRHTSRDTFQVVLLADLTL